MKMYHDLYVPFTSNQAELQKTLSFLDERESVFFKR